MAEWQRNLFSDNLDPAARARLRHSTSPYRLRGRTHKACSMCKRWLKLDQFLAWQQAHLHTITYHNLCHDCRRKYHRMRNYGLTAEQHDALFSSPQCAICGNRSPKRLNVDHDHRSGMVRGLLCQRCNVLVGYLEQPSALILAAHKYIGKFTSADATTGVEMKYAIRFEKTATGYSAHAPDLPGCVAAGATLEETGELMEEAIQMHLDGMREDGEVNE